MVNTPRFTFSTRGDRRGGGQGRETDCHKYKGAEAYPPKGGEGSAGGEGGGWRQTSTAEENREEMLNLVEGGTRFSWVLKVGVHWMRRNIYKTKEGTRHSTLTGGGGVDWMRRNIHNYTNERRKMTTARLSTLTGGEGVDLM